MYPIRELLTLTTTISTYHLTVCSDSPSRLSTEQHWGKHVCCVCPKYHKAKCNACKTWWSLCHNVQYHSHNHTFGVETKHIKEPEEIEPGGRTIKSALRSPFWICFLHGILLISCFSASFSLLIHSSRFLMHACIHM